MHLVLGIIRVQLGGAAGVLQGVDAVAQALVGQGGEVIPAGVPGVHAVQHPAGLGVAAVHDEVAGGLHLGAVGAVVAGTALLLVAAKVEPETERVEIKAAKIGIAVVLTAVIAVLLVAALLLIIAVGVAVALLPVTIAAGLLLGLTLGDGIVSGLHLLEVLFSRRVVGVQVRVPALALGPVCLFDLFIACTALDAQHLIGVSHRSTSSRL